MEKLYEKGIGKTQKNSRTCEGLEYSMLSRINDWDITLHVKKILEAILLRTQLWFWKIKIIQKKHCIQQISIAIKWVLLLIKPTLLAENKLIIPRLDNNIRYDLVLSIILFACYSSIYIYFQSFQGCPNMPLQNSLDFAKLFCAHHPCQLITNYCNDQKCLVGLCATCICSHTQMHAQIGTVPQYQNVRDTFCLLHDQLRSQVSLLEDGKCKLGSVREEVEVKKITIRKTIRQLKEDTLSKIKEEFDMLEKKIMADINAEEKKQGYHSSIRFETLEKNLTRETQNLLGYIEGLNSPNFLDWAKKLKKQSLHEANQNRMKIEQEIADNQSYTANLKWNQSFSSQLEQMIRRVFTLEFVVPKPNCESRNSITVLRQSNANPNNVSRASSQPKLSQSLMKSNSLMGLSKFAQSTSYSTFFPEPEKNFSSTLQKQSVLRKNSSIVPETHQNDSKQNWLARSSYVSVDPLSECFNRQSMINNLSVFTRPTLQNQRLSSLIETKKSTMFDSHRTSTLTKEDFVNENSRIRMMY